MLCGEKGVLLIILKKKSGIKELEVFEALLLVRSILKNGGGACEAGGMYVCML